MGSAAHVPVHGRQDGGSEEPFTLGSRLRSRSGNVRHLLRDPTGYAAADVRSAASGSSGSTQPPSASAPQQAPAQGGSRVGSGLMAAGGVSASSGADDAAYYSADEDEEFEVRTTLHYTALNESCGLRGAYFQVHCAAHSLAERAISIHIRIYTKPFLIVAMGSDPTPALAAYR